jgi:hypothetical protein
MAADDLSFRLQRIYAAIGAAQEFDMSKLPAKVVSTEHMFGIFQDFAGGMSDAAMANTAQLIIHNIASLHDHLRTWAAKNGKDKERVTAVFDASPPLQILYDLWNADKHGPTTRLKESRSEAFPRLTAIRRVMRLTARPGGGVVMMLDRRGKTVVSGEGSACAVVTGDVENKDGKPLGDLYEIEQQAVQAWEGLLKEFGVSVAADAEP